MPSPLSAASQIEHVLRAKAQALVQRDAAALSALMDADFVYVNSHGNRLGKAQYLELCCTSGQLKFQSQTFTELTVTDLGSFAVATMRVQDQFEYEGEVHSGQFHAYSVFRKISAGWLWAGGQAMAAH